MLVWVAPGSVLGAMPSTGTALGVQGGGSGWPVGNPTLRWRPSPSQALDFTPSFSYSCGPSSNYEYSYRFEACWVRTVRTDQMLLVGLRIAPGYSRYVSRYYRQRTCRYSIDICVGPDLEYFLPILPRLSVGITGVVRIHYTARDLYSSGALYATSYGWDMDILGQWLTVRYYF